MEFCNKWCEIAQRLEVEFSTYSNYEVFITLVAYKYFDKYNEVFIMFCQTLSNLYLDSENKPLGIIADDLYDLVITVGEIDFMYMEYKEIRDEVLEVI